MASIDANGDSVPKERYDSELGCDRRGIAVLKRMRYGQRSCHWT
jgi:hypothetical protein